MFEDLEAAKRVLREIDGHLTIGNDDAVRAKVQSAIALIDRYESLIRDQKRGQ